jgi:hypothetical protein
VTADLDAASETLFIPTVQRILPLLPHGTPDIGTRERKLTPRGEILVGCRVSV